MEIFMRKILLASTALVAAAGISAASAEISLSGSTKIQYISTSSNNADNASAGENGTKYGGDTNLGMSWSSTTDSGLSLSVSYDIDADEGSASITGDWGTLTFADNGNDAMGIGMGNADVVSNMRITDASDTITYNGEEAINGGRLAYSNSISGISFGIGLGDSGTGTASNETSYGVSYSSSVNGADVTIGYATANTGADNTSTSATDLNATSMTLDVTVGSIGVSMAQNTQKADNGTGAVDDLKSTNFGVTYAITDSLTLQAASVAASGTSSGTSGYKYDESAYGIAYTIASGVSLAVSYSDYSQSDNTAGSGTNVQLSVAF
jgi:outer membrane protein OmpU